MKNHLLFGGLLITASLHNSWAGPHVLDNAWYSIRLKAKIPVGQAIDQTNPSAFTTNKTPVIIDTLANSVKSGLASGCFLNVRDPVNGSKLNVALYCAANHGNRGIGWEYEQSYNFDLLAPKNNTSPIGCDWCSFLVNNNRLTTWQDPTFQGDPPHDALLFEANLVLAPKSGATDGKGSKLMNGKGFIYFSGNESRIFGGTSGSFSAVKWIDAASIPSALQSCADAWWASHTFQSNDEVDFCH